MGVVATTAFELMGRKNGKRFDFILSHSLKQKQQLLITFFIVTVTVFFDNSCNWRQWFLMDLVTVVMENYFVTKSDYNLPEEQTI